MALTNEDIIKAVSAMSIIEIMDLIKKMEEKFGVSSLNNNVAVNPSIDVSNNVDEQTEFTIILTKVGDRKVNAIKAVREITGLGLKEAKAVVDTVPSVVKEGLSKTEAASAKNILEKAGATVDIK